jgi:isopropylmalate/homocitrate/citramalate synthase
MTGVLPFKPELIGAPAGRYVLGKGAGRGLVEMKLREMGISATDEQLTTITERIKEESMIRKGEVPDREVAKIVREVKGEKS